MKTFLLRRSMTALAMATLLLSANAQERRDEPAPPATREAKELSPADGKTETTAAQPAVQESWDLIKDYTFDQRNEFIAALIRMSKAIDEQVLELSAKRPLTPTVVADDWEFALKELDSARSDLKWKISELAKTRPDNWADARERVATAWQRTQEAFDSVKATSTSWTAATAATKAEVGK